MVIVRVGCFSHRLSAHYLSLVAAAAAVSTEFSQATVNCFDPLEQSAARSRLRSVVQAAATECGKHHYHFHSTPQQQQVQLCPATQQGLKHWLQAAQVAGAADIWLELWAGHAADLEQIISKAFAAGFCAHLEESTMQHYVRALRRPCLQHHCVQSSAAQHHWTQLGDALTAP